MYPSDLTDAQWSRLEPLLSLRRPDVHAGGRPRKYALQGLVNAVLYLVKTGCQWRQLPENFPPWQSVYQQFRAWRGDGTWEHAGTVLRQRVANGRNALPCVAIVDAQTVKTALKGGSGGTPSRHFIRTCQRRRSPTRVFMNC